MPFLCRKAVEADVDAVYRLLQFYKEREILLPRSREQIISGLPSTYVAADNGEVIASLNFTRYSDQLYEIRALVVAEKAQGRKTGTNLLSFSLEHFFRENRNTGTTRIFALTYVPEFFEINGFRRVAKEEFPDKIYEDCRFCSRKDDCREIAVVKDHERK